MKTRILIAAREPAELKFLGALAQSACAEAALVFAGGEGEAARALHADGPFRLVLLAFAPGPSLQVHLAPRPDSPEWLHADELPLAGGRHVNISMYNGMKTARDRITSLLKS